MKTVFRFKSVAAALMLATFCYAQTGAAALAPKYVGDFEMKPEVVHKNAITGKMTLTTKDGAIAEVRMKLDQPVMGKTELGSSEQWSQALASLQPAQTIFVFKLQGTPHKYYFTYVTTSVDGDNTLQGTLYRVNGTMNEVQALLKNGVPDPMPATMKIIGSAVVKSQQ